MAADAPILGAVGLSKQILVGLLAGVAAAMHTFAFALKRVQEIRRRAACASE